MMSAFAMTVTSLGLGTDAFAAALARGGLERRAGLMPAFRVGAVFGLSEGLMALAGWGLGRSFSGVVTAVDHWVALVVLAFIGARMIREGLSGAQEEDGREIQRRTLVGTIFTALGTSVDAAAVGVALAVTGQGAWTALAIGAASFMMSSAGYALGPVAGRWLGRHAEIAGGGVIMCIGFWIFASHVSADGWF